MSKYVAGLRPEFLSWQKYFQLPSQKQTAYFDKIGCVDELTHILPGCSAAW